MSAPDRDESLRDAVRGLLGELLPRTNGASAHATGAGGSGAGANMVVPAVPAPPVAAVLRPSTWRAPAAPGEVIGEGGGGTGTGADGAAGAGVAGAAGAGAGVAGAAGAVAGAGVAGAAGAGGGPSRPGAATFATGSGEPVRIDDDVDLNGFARALAERLQDPGTRDAIRAGRLRFSLQRSGAGAAHAAGVAQPHAAPVQSRTVTGPVTERTIKAAAADGARLVLGPGAVLTPLARDCARSLGVQIEKERGC